MAASAGSQHRCVFVGNIPYDATEEQLIQICEEVGPVVSFRLVLDRETGKPKGYGFCEYKDEETALSARRNLQGYEINGRQLRVDFAENDKGADRNREQGRGGPGFTSSNDAHKAISGSPILGDSSLHQPIGHPVAANAASSMARALGGPQSSRLPLMQNGLQNLSTLGNDPLTQYLAKMSRQQLNEIMSEMKSLVVQNKALAQQLLQGCPQLPKALFQAQIMLGMVTPQMMQMANNRQFSSSVPQPALRNNMPNQNPLLPSHLGQTQVSSALQNPVILQQSSIPLQQLPVQPPFQHPLPPQAQTLLQGTVPGKSGITAQPQTFASVSNQPQIQPLPTSKSLISQVQPPVLQHSRTPAAANVGQHPQLLLPDNLQQAYVPPLTSQSGSSNYPVMPNGLDSLSKEAGTYAAVSHDSTWASRGSMHSISSVGLAAQTGTTSEVSEVMNHRSKRPKLEDGDASHLTMTDTFSTISSVPAQSIVAGSVVGSQMANADGLQHSEKQMPRLAPEVESALLQQVMSLTPEQLSSLPLEQQQQVLQLQQMLVKQNL